MLNITNGSGKMAKIQSINTSTLENDFCKKMINSDAVCQKCYAKTYEKMRPTLHNALLKNHSALSDNILPLAELPYINAAFLRINSFGELINEKHFKNILNLATKNSHCQIVLWTKRKNIVAKVLESREKPENLTLIYSSPKLNKTEKLPAFFNKVFTVFDKTHKNAEFINCGGKSCNDCRICYTKNEVVFVNELLK